MRIQHIDTVENIIPGSIKDNDQYFYQKGYRSGDPVSCTKVYEDDGKLLLACGLEIRGEQTVFYCEDPETNQPISFDKADERGIESQLLDREPEIFLETLKKQKEFGSKFLEYGLNCWLETYYLSPEGQDLTRFSKILQSDAETALSSIEEFSIKSLNFDEIRKAVALSREYLKENPEKENIPIPNLIESVSGEKCELEVYECGCGFHLGIDATYLDQVTEEVNIPCPSCGQIIQAEKDEKDEGTINGYSKIYLSDLYEDDNKGLIYGVEAGVFDEEDKTSTDDLEVSWFGTPEERDTYIEKELDGYQEISDYCENPEKFQELEERVLRLKA